MGSLEWCDAQVSALSMLSYLESMATKESRTKRRHCQPNRQQGIELELYAQAYRPAMDAMSWLFLTILFSAVGDRGQHYVVGCRRETAQITFASLSACLCADMEVGCIVTPSRLVACGSDEREHERLGSATSVFGAIAELADDERDESDL